MTDIINRTVLFKENNPVICPPKTPCCPEKKDKTDGEIEQKVESFSDKDIKAEEINKNPIADNKFDDERTAAIFGQSESELSKEFRAFKAAKIFKKFDCDLTAVSDPETLNAKVDEAIKYGFGNLVVTPRQVKAVKQRLKGRKIGVFAAVCYPFGEEVYGVKKYASQMAFSEGADGIYLPVGVSDVLKGRLEGVRREFSKIVKRHKRKKVFAVLEVGKFDLSSCEKVLKALSKVKLAGIVSGTGGESGERLSGVSELHSLSGGKRAVIACSTSDKSREVISLFSVADRIFLSNATKIATDLRSNLDY